MPARKLTPRVVLLSLDEAAGMLGCHPRTIRRRIAEGELRAYRVGPAAIRVDQDDILAMLRPIPTGGDAA